MGRLFLIMNGLNLLSMWLRGITMAGCVGRWCPEAGNEGTIGRYCMQEQTGYRTFWSQWGFTV